MNWYFNGTVHKFHTTQHHLFTTFSAQEFRPFVNYDQHFKFEAKENVILDINMFKKTHVLNTSS